MITKEAAIQCLWIGTALSRMEIMCIKSYLKNAHTVYLYAYDNVENVPEGVTVIDANTIIPSDKIFKYKHHDSYAAFANLFRYKLLLEKGGYWTDLDNVCIRTLPTPESFVFASERLTSGDFSVNNCFMYATKDSEIMNFCYSTALSKKPEQLNWGDTGPRLLTEAVIKYDMYDYVLHPDVVCPVDPWRCQLFVSKSLADLINEETYTVHLWNEIWKRSNMDKNARYNATCLYEELQQRFNAEASL
jgi:hypothetical protein